MTLKNWVASNGGVHGVAAQLGTTHFAVYVWLRGAGAPEMGTAAKIVKLSKGNVSFAQIYKESTRNKKV